MIMFYVNRVSSFLLRTIDGLDRHQWIMIMGAACVLGFIILRGFSKDQRL